MCAVRSQQRAMSYNVNHSVRSDVSRRRAGIYTAPPIGGNFIVFQASSLPVGFAVEEGPDESCGSETFH